MNSSLTWQRQVLPNGLRVLQKPNPSALTAQVSLAIEYGSNDDAQNVSGVAHFLEHMIVGGSKERIKQNNMVERLGGYSHFETSEEATFTAVNVFPQKIVESSKILSTLLFDCTFEEEKLELERKVILNEIAEASDDPWEKTSERFLKCLYKQHPVKNPVLGTKNTVNQITRQTIQETHNIHYSPQNMILILTGNITEQDAQEVICQFSSRENSSTAKRNLKPSEQGKPRREAVIEKTGIAQAYFCFGLRTIPAKHQDTPPLDLLNSVLGLGESSRLFRELREKRALTYDFSSMNTSGLDFGYFAVSCAVKTASIKQAHRIINDELEKLTVNKVDEEELVKCKNVVLGDIFRAMDSSADLPRILADMEIYFQNQNALAAYTQQIQSLTAQDLMEAASKYFKEENYSTAILKPKTLN